MWKAFGEFLAGLLVGLLTRAHKGVPIPPRINVTPAIRNARRAVSK